MGVHITNIYGFVQDEELRKSENEYGLIGHKLGFTEMGIFNFAVETDEYNELSKRLDGIISSLQFNDTVFFQLPSGNGAYYDNFLMDKIKAYNAKVAVILHKCIDSNDFYILNKADIIMPINDSIHEYLKDNNFNNIFYKDNINYDFPVVSDSSSILSKDFYKQKYLIDALDLLTSKDEVKDEDVIHIGFGLHDKDGHYSVWVGTAMLSIIEHTNSKICFHILHDDTLTEDNRNKLKQVAEMGKDYIEFHRIDVSEFDSIKERVQRFTIGSMFRCLLPEMLYDLDKIIYLDADLFVNRDIKELWDIDISSYCLGAVKDEGISPMNYPNIIHKYPELKDRYINSGVLIMNLVSIRKHGNLLEEVSNFIINNPEAGLPDQDALNMIYFDSLLLLDSNWNRFTFINRKNTKDNLDDCIYHYAGSLLLLYSDSKIDEEYFKTICRTPWKDYESTRQLRRCFERLNDRILQYTKLIPTLMQDNVKYIFYGSENFTMKEFFKHIDLKPTDYRVLKNPDNNCSNILSCKKLDSLLLEKEPFVIFVCYESDNFKAIENLENMGFENEKDFFVISRILSCFNGGFA